MFLKSYFPLFLAGFVLSSSHNHEEHNTGGLHVELSVANSQVTSVNDLKLTATVTNTGAESIKVIRYSNVLDGEFGTKSFVVTKDGEPVPFTGVSLVLSMFGLDDTAFTTIPPGKNVTVNHEVGTLYDFVSTGPGNYTFEPVSNFMTVNGPNDFTTVEATSNSVTVVVTGYLGERSLHSNATHVTNDCADPSKKAKLVSSYNEALNLIQMSSSYISSHGSGDSAFMDYFGTQPSAQTIIGLYNNLPPHAQQTSYHCAAPSNTVCNQVHNIVAYAAGSNVYYCDNFFNPPFVPASQLCHGTAVDSNFVRGANAIQLLSSLYNGKSDFVQGCVAGRGLDDVRKWGNAVNYACFSQQVYRNAKC